MQPALRERFNRTMAAFHDGIRDFIVFHYFLASRTEPFWLAARAPEVASDTLAENLDLWRHRFPTEDDLAKGGVFTDMSYTICMTAKGYYRDAKFVKHANVSPARWQTFATNLGRTKSNVHGLPSVRDYLVKLRGESPPLQRNPVDVSLIV